MTCPFCLCDNDKVLDTRKSPDGFSIRRRRECLNCEKRFSTHEIVESQTIIIIKKSGERQPYDRDKVMYGLLKACEKRPVDVKTIDQVTTKVDRRIKSLGKKEILSGEIGNILVDVLKSVDIIAYVRFISVYKEFENLEEFVDELNSVIKKYWLIFHTIYGITKL